MKLNGIKLGVIVASLIGVVALSTPVLAHQGPPPGGPGQRGPGGRRGMMGMDDKILGQLSLTSKQKTKVAALKKSIRAKIEAMRGSMAPGGDRSAMRAKFQGIRKSYHEGLSHILSKKQLAKYDKLMAAERAKRRAAGPGGPGRPGGRG